MNPRTNATGWIASWVVTEISDPGDAKPAEAKRVGIDLGPTIALTVAVIGLGGVAVGLLANIILLRANRAQLRAQQILLDTVRMATPDNRPSSSMNTAPYEPPLRSEQPSNVATFTPRQQQTDVRKRLGIKERGAKRGS